MIMCNALPQEGNLISVIIEKVKKDMGFLFEFWSLTRLIAQALCFKTSTS